MYVCPAQPLVSVCRFPDPVCPTAPQAVAVVGQVAPLARSQRGSALFSRDRIMANTFCLQTMDSLTGRNGCTRHKTVQQKQTP